MSHGDRVETVPAGFTITAGTDHAPLAAMSDESRRFYGVQFHPEVTHTKQGAMLLQRFVRDICGCADNWRVGNIIDDAIERVRAQVGTGKVLLGLSGGVDSSVVAALLHKAIGDQLVCVFVDHRPAAPERRRRRDAHLRGSPRREGHPRQCGSPFPRRARRRHAIRKRKRKIIGKAFIEVFDEESHKLEGIDFLAQGTIYPDVIESAGARTGKAHVIKSHHNVGGLPANMRMKLRRAAARAVQG